MFDQKEYQRQYREKHREHLRANSRVYSKAYRSAHYEHELERNRLYRKEHPEIYRAWYLKNKEKCRIYGNAWNLLNRHSPHVRFLTSRKFAKYRGLEWNISEPDYCELVSKRCHYCDADLPRIRGGLDRMDNNKGYLIGNVVPCCFSCNKVKNNVLTYEEMKIAMNSVKEFRLKKALEGVSTWL